MKSQFTSNISQFTSFSRQVLVENVSLDKKIHKTTSQDDRKQITAITHRPVDSVSHSNDEASKQIPKPTYYATTRAIQGIEQSRQLETCSSPHGTEAGGCYYSVGGGASSCCCVSLVWIHWGTMRPPLARSTLLPPAVVA